MELSIAMGIPPRCGQNLQTYFYPEGSNYSELPFGHTPTITFSNGSHMTYFFLEIMYLDIAMESTRVVPLFNQFTRTLGSSLKTLCLDVGYDKIN